MNHTIEGYRDFLVKRDGEADLLNRRLANREQFFNELEANAVRSTIRQTGTCSCETCAGGDPNPAWMRRAVSAGDRQAEPGRTLRDRTR
jgi:hypothetical protein